MRQISVCHQLLGRRIVRILRWLFGVSLGSSEVSKYNSFLMSRTMESDINYQLMHNKDALEQLSKKSKQKEMKSINENMSELKEKGFLYKQSKYKVYPSKIIEEQKR